MIRRIAVAAPEYPASISDALDQVRSLANDAMRLDAEIICFPETYLPGYPIAEFERESCSATQLQAALEKVRHIARDAGIAIIIPMDWYAEPGFLNVAFVVSKDGAVMGYQTKNQLDPSEDNIWQAGNERRIFELDGLKFGITICHEGFRYPESVRWAARQGAHVVFHPNFTGSNRDGNRPAAWGATDSPYYEKAQMMRAMENTIYFAPSNYACRYPESASAIIDPEGNCIAWQEYGKPGIAVAAIDTEMATGILAKRYRPLP